jgi:hypothetical protein
VPLRFMVIQLLFMLILAAGKPYQPIPTQRNTHGSKLVFQLLVT